MQALERPADGAAAGGLVFFHGYYGIPDEFLGFVDKLDPTRRLHAFLPQAMHGRADESVPVADARQARDTLRELGVEPLYLETDIDHRIDQAIVPALRDFVALLP